MSLLRVHVSLNMCQCVSLLQVEKRYNYTTPKTFLELIKLYKSVLARKRNQVQEAIDRLDTVGEACREALMLATCSNHTAFSQSCDVYSNLRLRCCNQILAPDTGHSRLFRKDAMGVLLL